VIFIQIGLNIFQSVVQKNQTTDNDTKMFEAFRNQTLEIAFPTLLVISVLTSSGLYVVTPVKDREDKLRYLLNFAGISSGAYYIGLYTADLILFIVPCFLIMIVSFIL
jgi:ABC-type multidrug transport system permease subunit